MSSRPAQPARAMRSDARQNRARILAAAAEAISEQGPGVSLLEIARRAGVGYATVHRNFSKDELVEELFGPWFGRRREVAEQAPADPDSWRGLVMFLSDVLADDGTRNRIMGALFALNPGWREQTRSLTQAPLTRAQDSGAVRADLTTTDVTLAVIGVARMMVVTGDTPSDHGRRHLALVLDGMRAGAPERLPGLPLSLRELETRIDAWSRELLRTGTSAS